MKARPETRLCTQTQPNTPILGDEQKCLMAQADCRPWKGLGTPQRKCEATLHICFHVVCYHVSTIF